MAEVVHDFPSAMSGVVCHVRHEVFPPAAGAAAGDPDTVVADDDQADRVLDDALEYLFGRRRLGPSEGRAARWVEGDGVFAVTPLKEAPDAIELGDEVLHSLVVSLEGVESNFDLANELFDLLRPPRKQLSLPIPLFLLLLSSLAPVHLVIPLSSVTLTALARSPPPPKTLDPFIDVRRWRRRRGGSLVEWVEIDSLDADGWIQDSMQRFIEPLLLVC